MPTLSKTIIGQITLHSEAKAHSLAFSWIHEVQTYEKALKAVRAPHCL